MITFQVMAVAEVSAEDEHAVKAALETLYHMERVDAARTHRSQNTNGGRVLIARYAGKIGPCVRTPVAKKSEHLGLKVFIHF